MSRSSQTDAPRTGRKRERTRRELVDAAEQLVAERGIDALSIDEITAAADVAKGTFYTHFADKNDLAAAIAHRTRMDLENGITRLNEGISDAAVRMANGLSSMFAFAVASPVRARAMLRLQPGVVDPDDPINTGLRNDVSLGLRTKRFAAISLQAATVTIIGAAMAAILRLASAGGARGTGPSVFAADIITMILSALGLKQTEAAQIAKAAVIARSKESQS